MACSLTVVCVCSSLLAKGNGNHLFIVLDSSVLFGLVMALDGTAHTVMLQGLHNWYKWTEYRHLPSVRSAPVGKYFPGNYD